jgi:hypothetical protein
VAMSPRWMRVDRSGYLGAVCIRGEVRLVIGMVEVVFPSC